MGKSEKTSSYRGRVAALAFGTAAAGVLILGAGRADAAVTIVDQSAETDNTGVAVANTGGNVAVGNASDNTATNRQRANAGPAGDDAVAANIGGTSNRSGGTATVHTGDATATGNHAATTQSQAVSTGGSRNAVVLADQDSDVTNTGAAIANTGLNAAVGNVSDNDVRNRQRAVAGPAGEDSVAVNIGGTGNDSNGTAAIHTGDAWAAGNVSDTYVGQALWAGSGPGGITVTDQDSDVDNIGFGLANTGLNLAVGNASDNNFVNNQFAFAGPAGDDAVAVNIGGAGNWSDGSAWISTGDATAIGNLSATTVCQGINTMPVCPRATVPHLGGTHVPGTVPAKPWVATATGGGGSHKVHHAAVRHMGVGGADLNWSWSTRGGLARTGAPLTTQALFGMMLLGVGAVLRQRRASVASSV